MTASPLPPSRIPKFERLRRMAARYPALGVDLGVMETYMMLLGVSSDVLAAGGSVLGRFGLGEGRFGVLALLLESEPEPMSHSELADLSCVTKGSITGLVDGLEHDGYVKRADSGEDRRVRLITLTPAGRELIERVLPDHFRRVSALLGPLSPAERQTLVALLAKVQGGLAAFKGE